MTTLLFLITRLYTKKPCAMCGVRIQKSDCVLYYWAVSVCGQTRKRQQTRKERCQCTMSMSCTFCHMSKLKGLAETESTADARWKLSVVIISHLLSFVPFAISTFVPPSAISKYLVECSDVWHQPLSHILPRSIVERITSSGRGFQSRFCLYQWLLIRLHNVCSLGLKQLSEFFIDLHHFSLVILMIVFVLRRNRIRPDLIHCEVSFVLVEMSVPLLLHLRMKASKLIICDM